MQMQPPILILMIRLSRPQRLVPMPFQRMVFPQLTIQRPLYELAVEVAGGRQGGRGEEDAEEVGDFGLLDGCIG